jgi:Ca-activated chloride channel family protein
VIAPQDAGALAPLTSAARGSLHLFGDYSLADPQFLALLPLALVALAWGRARAGRPQGRVSSLPALPRSARQRFLWIPPFLQALAMVLAIGCLARPLRGSIERDVTSAGVDIVLAVDRSGSMRFDDLAPGRTRLDVVKEVVGDFAERRMSDREGAADNVALVSFARYPQLLCPFTLDVDGLRGFLDGVRLVEHREEDGTAIGVALAKAVALLRDSEAKSKVVVLLTDGQNNVEDIAPLDAAELAAESGVRVHTIYAARFLYVYDPLRGYVATNQGHDVTELQAIAAQTEGRFWHARNEEELEGIYAEIETLERTERTERRYEEHFDLYPFLGLPALALYVLAWLSSATWARRLA